MRAINDKQPNARQGKSEILNPDLVEALRADVPLNPVDVRTFYVGGDHDYTDYPSLVKSR